MSDLRFENHNAFPAPESTGRKYMMIGGCNKEVEQSRGAIILFCTVNSCNNTSAAENYIKQAKGVKHCFCAFTAKPDESYIVDIHR